jgi:hypothetical protein
VFCGALGFYGSVPAGVLTFSSYKKLFFKYSSAEKRILLSQPVALIPGTCRTPEYQENFNWGPQSCFIRDCCVQIKWFDC